MSGSDAVGAEPQDSSAAMDTQPPVTTNTTNTTQPSKSDPYDVDWECVIADHEKKYAEGAKIREHLTTLLSPKLTSTVEFDVQFYNSLGEMMDLCKKDFPDGRCDEYYKDADDQEEIIRSIFRIIEHTSDTKSIVEQAFQCHWDQSLGLFLIRTNQKVRLAFFKACV